MTTIAAGGSVDEDAVSYDFMLMRLSPTPKPGPVSERIRDEAAHRPVESPLPLHDAMSASASFEPGAIRFERDVDDDRRWWFG